MADLAVSIGEREVLTSVSLEVGQGEILGIAGETGCGKSITCRALTGTLGLIGGRITGGSLLYDDVDLRDLSEREWRRIRGRRIGFVPQSSLSGLDPLKRVGKQLIETIRHVDPCDDVRTRGFELLRQVALPEPEVVFRAYPHELSGGMRQRFMIALAIAGRPQVLVADEPTTALDVTIQKGILELLLTLSTETLMSVILVTHDLAVIEDFANRIAIMYAGTTVEAGTTEEVLARPAHPYTVALLAARPGSVPAGSRLQGISGTPPAPEEWISGCRFAPRCSFRQSDCELSRPELEVGPNGHAVSCFHPVGIIP
jgi:oligopeptide/dipeptide ABC transporter ATP-binding protein